MTLHDNPYRISIKRRVFDNFPCLLFTTFLSTTPRRVPLPPHTCTSTAARTDPRLRTARSSAAPPPSGPRSGSSRGPARLRAPCPAGSGAPYVTPRAGPSLPVIAHRPGPAPAARAHSNDLLRNQAGEIIRAATAAFGRRTRRGTPTARRRVCLRLSAAVNTGSRAKSPEKCSESRPDHCLGSAERPRWPLGRPTPSTSCPRDKRKPRRDDSLCLGAGAWAPIAPTGQDVAPSKLLSH